MKHPARSDFDTAVTEAGVNVTFKPTKSTYSFYRLAESEDIARLGPVSLNVSDTRDRVAILRTILRMKFKTWRSGLLRMSARPFGQFKTRKRPTN
jgi:hypothetical protein